VAEITRRADAWDKAIVQKDVAGVAANMTDDFRVIRSNGDISNREAFLRGVTDPNLTIHPYTVEDFNIRLYGDMALVGGRTRMTGTSSGASFTLNYRYIDTYIRTGGTWKVCHVQVTEIPARPTP
jgi:ketosteroid isomerase-like protein